MIEGADLLIGLSGAKAMPAEALGKMNDDAMVFAMANPNPEVDPEEAAPYVRIMATGPLGLPQPDQQRAVPSPASSEAPWTCAPPPSPSR